MKIFKKKSIIRKWINRQVKKDFQRLYRELQHKHIIELNRKDHMRDLMLDSLRTQHLNDYNNMKTSLERSLESQHLDFEAKLKQLKHSYFLSNVDINRLSKNYQEGLHLINMMEENYYATLNQIEHCQEMLLSQIRDGMLKKVVETINTIESLTENFEKTVNPQKKRLHRIMQETEKSPSLKLASHS